MVVRTLRYNLNRNITRKDLEVGNCFWGYGRYNDYYSLFLLDRKHSYTNVYTFLKINSISLSISNKNVLTANFDALISNFFFLRYFTGKKPFFLPVKIVSSFQEKRYSYTCQVQLKREEAFYFFSKYITHASNTLSSLDFNVQNQSFRNNNAGFYMKNFSYFRVVGTHLAFLDWKATLEIKLILNKNYRFNELFDLLALLKFKSDLISKTNTNL